MPDACFRVLRLMLCSTQARWPSALIILHAPLHRGRSRSQGPPWLVQGPCNFRLGRVLICGRPAKCKRFFRRIGTLSDAAICPASDAAMELRARMGVRGPEPNHKCVLQAR